MAIGQKEERRRQAERIISQGRDRVVGPLERELAQVAEEMGRRGALYSSAHVDRRLEVYLQKTREMVQVVVKGFLDASRSPDDFTVDEIAGVATREIDAIRLRAFEDLAARAKTPGYSRPLESLPSEIEKIEQGARRDIEVALDGWRLESVKIGARKQVVIGDEVFVVMSFKPDLELIFTKAIEPAVQEAGRIMDRNLRAYRVDRDEPKGTITQAILDKIETAPLVVGDLTYERPNCYYELGYARGLGRPVVLMARKDHDPRDTPREENALRVHFDLDGHKITWWNEENLPDLPRLLAERIVRSLRGEQD